MGATAQPAWLQSPRAKYGIPTDSPTPANSSPLRDISGPSVSHANAMTPYHPESPLFWFGALTLTTFGLMAISGRGSIRVGPFRASAAAGAGKTEKKDD